MKHLALILIRAYWLLPEKKRRPCLFRESCSRYVYRIVRERGFIAGCKALKIRFQQCRPGYRLYKNGEHFELQLRDGCIVSEEQISPALLSFYNSGTVLTRKHS